MFCGGSTSTSWRCWPGNDASTGVPRIALQQVQQQATRTVQAGLYDALVLSYLAGYGVELGGFRVPAYDANLHAAAYNLLRLAVCVMGNYVA